ncbi:TolC family protein [Bernardetia sp. OM2101]|uniref:TolC family protein n=1 Tax=Bernardetia sp. OM2101 TaxID=3344876 RepID=UPI0035CEDA1F
MKDMQFDRKQNLFAFTSLFLSICFFFLAQKTIAQDTNTTPKWSLDSCIAYALRQNIQLKINELGIENSELALKQSKDDRLPNANASFSHNYNWGRSIDPFSNSFVNQRIQTNNLSLSSSTTLYNGSRLKNTISQNELQVEADKLNYGQAQNDLMLNIASNYLQVVLNKEIAENARRQKTSTQAQYDRTQQLVEAGVLPRANLYDLEAQLAADEQQIILGENNLMLAKLQLRQLMQLEPTESFDIITPEVDDPSAILDSKNPYQIYQIAETTQPNIKGADINIEVAKKGIDIAEAGRIPTLSLIAGAGSNYTSNQKERFDFTQPTLSGVDTIGYIANNGIPTDYVVSPDFTFPTDNFGFFNQLNESFRYNLGLNLQIPIFNRFQVDNGIQRAKIQTQNAQLNSKLVRTQLYQTIEQAYISARAAKASFEASQTRVKALEETVRVMEKRLEAGAANSTEYTVVKNNLSVAQADLLRAKYEFIFRIKVLEFYEGEELKF